MGNLTYIGIVCLLFSLLSIAGCGRQIPVAERLQRANDKPDSQKAVSFKEVFESVSGKKVDLGEEMRPFVLFFASETCQTCIEETRSLVDHFQHQGSLPLNVGLYTIVIGALPEDALYWKEALGVHWTVGTDPGDELFRTYCPELQTPCILTYRPASGEINQTIGTTSVEQLQKETEKWVYEK